MTKVYLSSVNFEIWVDIRGYEGKYQVSNFGRVKALNFHRTGKPEIMSLRVEKSTGYMLVNLRKPGSIETFTVHYLVASHFLFNQHGSYIRGIIDIHHKDGDKTNNHITNLEFIRRKKHLREHFGKKIAVLKDDKLIAVYNSIAEAAEIGNFLKEGILYVLRGEHKTHHGCTFIAL